MKAKQINKRTGFTMALVLMVIVLMLLLGTSLLSLAKNTHIASIRRSQEIAAKCAADAGLTLVMSQLNTAYALGTLELSNLPSGPITNIENSNANFLYSVYIDGVGNIRIDCTGASGPCYRTVHCIVDVESDRFEHALFADNFEIKNGAFIDGYNSNYGAYGGYNIISTSMGTNSTNDDSIKLDNNGYLNGNIVVGPDGKPSKVIDGGKHFDVTGSKFAADEEKNTPVISAPSLPDKGSSPSGTITEDGRYSDIQMTNGETITIEGHITLYITGKVELDNNAEIEISEGSSLTLYIEGEFKMSNGGKINNLNQKPPNCKVFSTATSEVDYCFDNVGEFYGAVYAPNGKIEIKNNAVIYGAILGKELKIDNSAEVYGDQGLRKGTFNDADTKLIKGRWWE